MKLCELEIKLALNPKEFDLVFQRCEELFGPPSSYLHQLDEYFDTQDNQLKQQDLVIRIRSNGDTQTIALKSPRVDLPNGMTKRIELEFKTLEGEKVRQQLNHQGLASHESAEKIRWTFCKDAIEIVLDKLPFIGTFIEIEGPSEEAIEAVISKLGLSSHEPIRNNYGELMKAKFKELQLPLNQIHATFAKEEEVIR